MAKFHSFFAENLPLASGGGPKTAYKDILASAGVLESGTNNSGIPEDMDIHAYSTFAYDGDNYGLDPSEASQRTQPFSQATVSQKLYDGFGNPQKGLLTPGRSPNLNKYDIIARFSALDLGTKSTLNAGPEPDKVEAITPVTLDKTVTGNRSSGFPGFHVTNTGVETQPTDVAFNCNHGFLYEMPSFPTHRIFGFRSGGSSIQTTGKGFSIFYAKNQQTTAGTSEVDVAIPCDMEFRNFYFIAGSLGDIQTWTIDLMAAGSSVMSYSITDTGVKVQQLTSSVTVLEGTKVHIKMSAGSGGTFFGYVYVLGKPV